MKKVLQKRMTFLDMKLLSLVTFMVISISGFSQSVGISPTGATTPNPAAGLDINFTNKGLLFPRLALVSTTSFAPLSAHIAGMLAYNTSTVSDVSPGIYYNNGTKWIPFFAKATAAGDIQYWDGTSWITIPAGLSGQTLQIDGSGVPVWVSGVLSTVNTIQLSAITSTTVTSGGIVLNDGGSTVTARGVCWATTSNPTISNNLTSDGTGIGSYPSSITGLSSGTLYYVRAYATTAAGTSYGNEFSFTTL